MKQREEQKIVVQSAIILTAVWTLLIGGSLAWNISDKHREVLELARKEAIANINKDISFRAWVASHGGVYVPPTEKTPPNPYLSHLKERDIVTADDQALTLMNPAYVTRQIHELYSDRYGIRGHLTSLNPINPKNAPDAWEKKALHSFESGNREYTELQTIDGKPVLRAMVRLIAEKSCLKCHAKQGYKEGDVRGGLGAIISMEGYLENEQRSVRIVATSHGTLWLFGCISIYFLFLLILRKTRERAQMTQALKESNKLFQTLSDYATEWNFWRNPDGTLRYVSPSCEKISGYSADELYAQPSLFEDMVHPDDQHRWKNHVHQADTDGHPKPIEYRILTKQGETRWVSHICRPLYDEDGSFIGVRGSNNDVTERRYEEELLILQSRHAAMGEMVGNIAHQWRQPLNALGILIANIKDAYEYNDLNQKTLDRLTQDGQRLIKSMSATIDDFRDFFKPDKEKKLFLLKEPVESALSILNASLHTHNIAVSVDVPDNLYAYGYPNEYFQVLLNILANAKDAIIEQGKTDGRIEIRGFAEDGQGIISIWDNGCGVPDELIEKIFEPYFTTKTSGTGIGLYMSRIIIESSMEGSITVRNRGGAEFVIRCPSNPPPAQPPAPE